MKRYAKTLYKPEFPDSVKQEIQVFTKQKLPAFFEFAKDKSQDQILERNNSFVNKLYSLVPNTKIDFRKLHLGNVDYKLLMNNPDIQFDIAFSETGSLDTEYTDPLIVKYCNMLK